MNRASLFLAVALAAALPTSALAQTDAMMSLQDSTGGTGGTIEIPVVVSFGGNELCEGYSFGACVDANVVAAIDVVETSPLPSSPFFSVGVTAEGWNVGVVFSEEAPGGLAPGAHEVCRLIGHVTAASPSTTEIESCLTGNTVPFDTVLVFLGQSVVPTLELGTVTIERGFIRGDCNFDGVIDIGDPIRLLNLFSGIPGQSQFTCPDACDANDDGFVDIADPITVLMYLFQSGSIPTPFLECGLDPTSDLLSECADPDSC